MKKWDDVWLEPESIDLTAQGVARHEGKVVFVREALPGERVRARIVRVKPKYSVADTIEVSRESSQRVRPRCPHYGVCGGCSMQHLAPRAQLAIKQRSLEDQLQHIGGVRPEVVLRPIAGPDWGYRYRARLAVRDVHKKGKLLVGFHEKRSIYVADMEQCHVLPPEMSRLLLPLRELIGSLSVRTRCPQIEMAIGSMPRAMRRPPSESAGSDGSGDLQIALVFRLLDPLSQADEPIMQAFATRYQVQVWLQSKGPDSIVPFDPANASLHYELPEFGLQMPFLPTDFTQVNHAMNNALISQAMRLLAPQPGERIADLFCGLGNFSLPIASRGASVLGLEGASSLCERARQAAALNGLTELAQFQDRDLFKVTPPQWEELGEFDAALIDPPRDGAAAIVQALVGSDKKPARIVYVSCNPATLARDAGILCHPSGYTLKAAGIINMFPHTSHVESIAYFQRN